MQSPVYVVGTSTWIHLNKVYPASVFPSLALRCEEMIRSADALALHCTAPSLTRFAWTTTSL